MNKEEEMLTLSRVDVIVYVHQGIAEIEACLKSVVRNSSDYHLIIAVDTKDKEVIRSLTLFSSQNDCTLIENLDTLGYAKSVNKALKGCAAGYIVLLEGDCLVTKTWLENMLAGFSLNESIGIVTPLLDAEFPVALREKFNLEMMAVLAENASLGDPLAPESFNRPCYMIKSEVLKAIGPLDERISAGMPEVMEEYCLRARDAGFKTRLAEACCISRPASGNMGDAGAQKCVKRIEQLLHSAPGIPALFGKSILFLLPSSGGSGGAQSVVQEAAMMREYGLKVKVATLASYAGSFGYYYPEAQDFCFAYTDDNDDELLRLCSGFDIIVATNYHSVKHLKKIIEKRPEVIPFYYVQDHEPWFFPQEDPRHKEAVQSYTLISRMVCFAYSDWVCNIIHALYGVRVAKIKHGLDRSIFHDGIMREEMSGSPLRITAMIRPSSPRRSPAETLRILKIIKQKYKNRVDIRVFGCNDEELDLMDEARGFCFVNMGELTKFQVGELLKGCDIFIDASKFQAFGCTGLEAMATGCVAVLPKDSGVMEYGRDKENCLLVDTAQSKEVIAAVERLIGNKRLMFSLRKEGIKTGSLYSLRKAAWSEMALFSQALGAGWTPKEKSQGVEYVC
jgi:GT2 family glycosyltransferase/glycosyltransferase involved in cell wall biosynthesis